MDKNTKMRNNISVLKDKYRQWMAWKIWFYTQNFGMVIIAMQNSLKFDKIRDKISVMSVISEF